jgi:integrase
MLRPRWTLFGPFRHNRAMPMAILKLTAANLPKSTSPPDKGVNEIWDEHCRGLCLLVRASGKATWTYRYRPRGGGARRRVRLGEYPSIGLAEARKRADRQRGKVADGDDPQGETNAKRLAPTLSVLIDRYLDEAVTPHKKAATLAVYKIYLRKKIEPALGSRKAAQITRNDVAALHRKLGAETPVSANRALVALSGVFTYAGKCGLVPERFNPARGIDKFKEEGRERYLSTDELARLGTALRLAESEGLAWPEATPRSSKHERKPENRKTQLSAHVVAAFLLLLFTGCRLREILHLRWSEVDFERGLLLLPDSKTGRKAVVLNAPALQVLTDLQRIGEFVILGDNPGKPRADLKKPWDLIRQYADLEDVRIHDLRHTHASIGAGAGLGLPIIGKLLGHRHSETTAKYAHLDNDPLRKASNRIGSEIEASLGRIEGRR